MKAMRFRMVVCLLSSLVVIAALPVVQAYAQCEVPGPIETTINHYMRASISGKDAVASDEQLQGPREWLLYMTELPSTISRGV